MQKAGIIKFFAKQSVWVLLVVYLIAAILFIPKFALPANLLNILIQSTDLIIISVGMVFVVMNGSIDFSVTSIIGLSSVVGALIMSKDIGIMGNSPFGWGVAVLVMLVIGIVIGCINGLAVIKLKMPSFIATMVTQLIFGGLALMITKSVTISGLPNEFLFIEQGQLFGIPFPIIITCVVLGISYYLLHMRVFGRHLFAIGTSHKTALISGVPVKKIIFITFVLCGGLAALGGIIMSSRIGSGMPSLGRPLFLDIIAAVIIGGTSITGGKGSIIGAAIGALFIVILNNSLSFLGVQWFEQNVYKGLLVLVVAILDIVSKGGAKFLLFQNTKRRDNNLGQQ